MRAPQPEGRRGSLMWLQRAVARRPDLLAVDGVPVRWLSPLRTDDFAEYRDAAFLGRLGLGSLAPALRGFWPARGPQWDALGLTGRGPLLVEAKAHVGEALTPPSKAGPDSLARIAAALGQARDALGADDACDWTRRFYQYTNRLAHLWWLREQGVDARLMMVCFVGDVAMGGPSSSTEWAAVWRVVDHALGLPATHALSPHILHVTPDVSALRDAP